jgi:hypothetical protein
MSPSPPPSLLRLHPNDTVAVVLREVAAGEVLHLDDQRVTAMEAVPGGHKIALRSHKLGDPVLKYGWPIGRATADIEPGRHVHTHNVRTGLSNAETYSFAPAAPANVTAPLQATFNGYLRAGGRVGTRNEIWVIPTVGCVARAARRIAERAHAERPAGVDGVYAFPHPLGCSQLGDDLSRTRKILASLAAHPNAGGVLGRSGTPIASWFMNEADLVITLGSSFAKHTGIAPSKPIIQVDFERMQLGRFHPVALPVWGEIAAFCSSHGSWLPLLCTMNVTTVTERIRQLFGQDHAGLAAAVQSVPAGSHGLLLLPYFAGERTPNVPDGTGTLLGLNQHTLDAAHLARAAMEGVTLGMNYGLRRLAVLGVKAKEIRVTGGGAKSPVWRQIMADVFGVPVVAMVEDEGAALGGALQAAWCVARLDGNAKARLSDFTKAVVAVDEQTRCKPDRKTHARYQKLQAVHDKLSLALREVFVAQRTLV